MRRMLVGLAMAGMSFGCGASSRELWYGSDIDLNKQVTSLQNQNKDSESSFKFGHITRAELEGGVFSAEGNGVGEAYKLVSITNGTFCVEAEDRLNQIDTEDVERQHIMERYGQDGWVAGAHASIETDFPPGVPWPKAADPQATSVKIVHVEMQKGSHVKGEIDPEKRYQGARVFTTVICVPAPQIGPNTTFISFTHLPKGNAESNRIVLWEITAS